ncbi:MAG TPA: NAD(P)H-dependent oxidoreductase [Ktedonobacteraceae bacterium]
MRILALSGSLRADSSNTQLLRFIAQQAPEGVEITLYEELGDLPHFSSDLDDANSSAVVSALRQQLQAADGVLICTPEYAFGVPGSLKNALDWTVSSGELWHKPTAVISASPLATGGEKAHASLLLTLTALSANVPEGGKLTIPAIKKKLSAAGDVIDPETALALKAVLNALLQTIETAEKNNMDISI